MRQKLTSREHVAWVRSGVQAGTSSAILREKKGSARLANPLVLLAGSKDDAEQAIAQLARYDDGELASNEGIRVNSRTFELLKKQGFIFCKL